MDRDLELQCLLLHHIFRLSQSLRQGESTLDELPSSAELARTYNLRVETVKKKLKHLLHLGLIHAISVSPKRYRFDPFGFSELDVGSEIYPILHDETSIYYLDI
ncbi:MAG: hypothetical protein K2X01_06520 [Cyanobacteria bacterium]|nr:hypothetical protein [Cyanobacteriota bacterium]